MGVMCGVWGACLLYRCCAFRVSGAVCAKQIGVSLVCVVVWVPCRPSRTSIRIDLGTRRWESGRTEVPNDQKSAREYWDICSPRLLATCSYDVCRESTPPVNPTRNTMNMFGMEKCLFVLLCWVRMWSDDFHNGIRHRQRSYYELVNRKTFHQTLQELQLRRLQAPDLPFKWDS